MGSSNSYLKLKIIGPVAVIIYPLDNNFTGRKRKDKLKFYGMSSYEAQEKYGGIKDYTASEGSVSYVPYKGDVSVVLKEIMGGLRSCCAYIGATCLKDMAKCTSYVRVSR